MKTDRGWKDAHEKQRGMTSGRADEETAASEDE